MSTPTHPHERLWTAREVANYLHVSISWVYHQAAAGLIPCQYIGSMLRFDPATTREFARAKRKPGPT